MKHCTFSSELGTSICVQRTVSGSVFVCQHLAFVL